MSFCRHRRRKVPRPGASPSGCSFQRLSATTMDVLYTHRPSRWHGSLMPGENSFLGGGRRAKFTHVWFLPLWVASRQRAFRGSSRTYRHTRCMRMASRPCGCDIAFELVESNAGLPANISLEPIPAVVPPQVESERELPLRAPRDLATPQLPTP